MDQEKERKKKEEEEEKKRELETSLREAEEARREAEMVEELKAVLLTLLPEEPASDDPDCVRILLKCPSGSRLERRFLKTQPIQVQRIIEKTQGSEFWYGTFRGKTQVFYLHLFFDINLVSKGHD